ncbi:hypothetical protein SLE2022_015630 [Rubroshorea leprosula]
MGNCMRHGKSSAVWAGEDWGSLTSKPWGNDDGDPEMKRLLGQSPSTTEVKITISKKELEELAKKVNMQGLSLEQVLAKMVKEAGGYATELPEHHRHWRPVLQSIPEMD